MKIILFILLIFSSKTSSSEDDHKKSIHFKIHVPEIIRHHIHTKTISIYIHKLMSHDAEIHNKKNRIKDWTSYNPYDYNNGLEESHSSNYNGKKQKNMFTPYDDYLSIREDNYQPLISTYIYNDPDNLSVNEPTIYKESPMSVFGQSIEFKEIIDNRSPNVKAKTISPPSQYEIHENVDEKTPNNDINYKKIRVEDYRHGIKTESGKVINKNLNDFFDKKSEKKTFSNDAFDDKNYIKYDTHEYHGKYDKEIGLEQRMGKKHDDKRCIIARMSIR